LIGASTTCAGTLVRTDPPSALGYPLIPVR